jgi:SNF2 family DNA or RNA helicase
VPSAADVEILDETCPLITRYTRESGIPDDLLRKLHLLRNWGIPEDGDVPFKWPTRLRKTLWNAAQQQDTGIPFEPRQYQLQMAQCLSRMTRMINGDSVGVGKTAEAIISCAWLADRLPRFKVVVMCTKSTTGQWADEFQRFSLLRPLVMADKYEGLTSHPARFAQLEAFLKGDEHDVLICKYSSLIGTRRKTKGRFDEDGNPVQGRERISQEIKRYLEILKPYGENVLMILDECQRFKTVGSSARNMVQVLSRPCARVFAMTATVVKNDLSEFYSIASAIGIRPFGPMQEFYDDFCIFRDVFVGRGRYKQVLQGYRNVAQFKAGMRPFFFGRSQRQVKEPLPKLTTVIHPVDLNAEQKRLLLEDIPSGAYPLPPSVLKVDGEIVLRDRDPDNLMTMLSVYQLVANHPALLDPADKEALFAPALSPKEELLLDFLDGDYRGEKLICYTKSRSWIDRLEHLTKAGKFTERKFLRITGAENEAERNVAKALFQDPESGYDLIVINAAATEGVNLQQAAHMILLDLPWSWGDLLQLVGRMVRMASPNSACTLHIFAARGSVDEYAIETLKGKKGLFEQILGESHSAGLLDDRELFDLSSGMEQVGTDAEFLGMLKAHAKSIGLTCFLAGEQLMDASADKNYKMAFEPGAKKPKRKKPPADDDCSELFERWRI